MLDYIRSISGLVAENWPALLNGMGISLAVTLCAIVFGILIGTLLAVARLSPSRTLRWFATLYVNLFRSIPLVMVLLWFLLIIPQFLAWLLNLPRDADLKLVQAIVAFSLFEAAYYSEIIRAGINSVSRGQMNAALALGMTRGQAMRLIILPQAFRVMTPLLLTQGVILFQDTSLVYILLLSDFFGSALRIGKIYGSVNEMIIFTGVVYFIICGCVSMLVSYFKKRISV